METTQMSNIQVKQYVTKKIPTIIKRINILKKREYTAKNLTAIAKYEELLAVYIFKLKNY